MTSHMEIDSVIEHNAPAIKLENDGQNKDEKILVYEDNQIGNNHSFDNHENSSLAILERDFSKEERECANEAQDFGIPSNDRAKGIVSHISEEIIIKTEENIKMIDHQEENDHYDFSAVKVEMELDDEAQQKDNESILEPYSEMTVCPEQELSYDYCYRLPESYYCSGPSGTESLAHLENNKAEMQQEGQSSLKAKCTNSLLKVKKMPRAGTSSRDESDKKNKKELYKCFICFASYRKLSTYIRHKNVHLKKGTHQILRKRREGKHLKMIRGIAHFRCDKCNKSYTCEASLKVHIKMSHEHVPIKIIKTEPYDVPESNNLNLIGHQMGTDQPKGIFPGSQCNNTQCDSGPSLLKKSSELETLKYSILLLQQDSINAAEDILNEVKRTYNCPECLKFFNKTAGYRSHLNTHLKKKFMLLRNQKVGLLKQLKDMNKFPYFTYDSRYMANINADKHAKPTEIEIKGDQSINEKSFSVNQYSKTATTELQVVSYALGENFNNSKGIKETFSKDNIQNEAVRETNSHILGENDVLEDNTSILPSNSLGFESSKANEHVEKETYSCSKCFKSYVNPSAFREHLIQHLKEEMHVLYIKKREMYLRHMTQSKIFKCEKCGKEYLYDGFLKKHIKFCQGPHRNELKDMFLGFNMTLENNSNKREIAFPEKNGSESNITSSYDLTQNLNATTVSNVEPERSMQKNDECGFTSQPKSVNIQQGSLGVNSSNVEQKTSPIEAITALINETQHVCPKCPRTFETLSLYWQHLNKHYDRERHLLIYKKLLIARNSGSEKLYKCDQCSKSYIRKNRLDLHINSQHRSPVSPKNSIDISEEYKCTCGKVYTRKSRMSTCFKSHTVAKELPHCSNCRYHFQNEEELDMHRNFVHTEHRYLCKFCPVEYYTVEDLFTHLEIHKKIQLMEYKVIAENIEEKQYLKCFICKEISSDLNEFKLHFLNDHRKPYLCTICVKNFNDLDQFMSHTNTYHLSSRERWLLELLQAFFALMQSWECKPCKFRSENPDALAEHLHDHKTLNVVGLELMPKSANLTPRRKCVDCRRIYSSAKQLEEHRGLYHNPDQGSRRKVFQNSTTKSDNSTMKCLKCNIQFIAEGYLKAHFSTMRHVEVQSLLLNEQFVSANMSEIESKANIVVTID